MSATEADERGQASVVSPQSGKDMGRTKWREYDRFKTWFLVALKNIIRS